MKKGLITMVVIVLVVIVIVWISGSSSTTKTPNNNAATTQPVVNTTPSAPVSETTKVSSQISEYQNAELGFSVKYPTVWEKAEGNSGIRFVMPIDKTQVSTVATLTGEIMVSTGKCTFPPVTTVKDRGTIKVGAQTLNTISMSNTVQGRGYFNRMYSLQNDTVCYMFILSSVTLDPASKGLTGSNITQAQNNNKAIVKSADTAFTDMVKTFAFVASQKGVDETQAPK
ncbi:MAG: hypothetical protein RL536_329 [Candidatus Parcubacteria bacterium]|jgi:hypothetical protein